MASKKLVPVHAANHVDRMVLTLRGQQVILDRDLAALYGVSTRELNQAVTRHLERFPKDFMLRLHLKDLPNLKSQVVTSSWGGSRKAPRAFTEQGVAMLSGLLRSARAVRVNIEIMRAFVRLRRMLQEHADLAERIAKLEQEYDGQFRVVFAAIRRLMDQSEPRRNRIGFHQPTEGAEASVRATRPRSVRVPSR